MNKSLSWLCCFFVVLTSGSGAVRADDQGKESHQTTRELDSYWAEVSRCVREGDFEGYSVGRPEGKPLTRVPA